VFVLGVLSRKIRTGEATAGFFAGLTALLFLVEGPVQRVLPGEGLTLAWPLYTLIGALVVIGVSFLAHAVRT
ncbi:MAG: sodium:solute symporter, partial [Candidatus Aminicenantales bacterium]